MAKKRFGPEQVVAKLRQIDVLTSAGKALLLACQEAGITDVSYYVPTLYKGRKEPCKFTKASAVRNLV